MRPTSFSAVQSALKTAFSCLAIRRERNKFSITLDRCTLDWLPPKELCPLPLELAPNKDKLEIWLFTQIWNDFLFGVVFGGSDTQPITVALLICMVAGKYFVRGLSIWRGKENA